MAQEDMLADTRAPWVGYPTMEANQVRYLPPGECACERAQMLARSWKAEPDRESNNSSKW